MNETITNEQLEEIAPLFGLEGRPVCEVRKTLDSWAEGLSFAWRNDFKNTCSK